MIKKLSAIILIIIILFNIGSNCLAIEISSADLVKIGTADYHLKYYREDRGYSTFVVCSIVGYYNQNGVFLPTYCMNKDLPGAETTEYTVNIQSLVNNDAVWRVVKNGWPYKSASEMGLSSDFDAYAVTKLAIYCVLGQSNLSYYSADSDDSVGQQMLSVLNNLVNIGFNGTETKASGTMSISKINGFLDAGGYYYQDYIVSSSVNMTEFVASINNFPEGTYIADIYNNSKSTFSNGETLRILIPTDKLNSDINGEIHITGKCETYPIFYGEAPDGYQDYVVTYSTYGNEEISTNLQIQTNTGSLKVLKIDDENEFPIQDVSFILKSEDGTFEITGITDENGEIVFDNLYQGNYILIETETNENYEFDINNQNIITINYNEPSEITIGNKVKKGKIKIIKKDYDTGEYLQGVEFNILDAYTEEVIETLVTDENGEAESSYLRIDKNYLLQETKTLEKYILNDENFYFNVTADEILEIEIENKKIPEEPYIPEVEVDEPEEPEEEILIEPEPVVEIKILPKTGF